MNFLKRQSVSCL